MLLVAPVCTHHPERQRSKVERSVVNNAISVIRRRRTVAQYVAPSLR